MRFEQNKMRLNPQVDLKLCYKNFFIPYLNFFFPYLVVIKSGKNSVRWHLTSVTCHHTYSKVPPYYMYRATLRNLSLMKNNYLFVL